MNYLNQSGTDPTTDSLDINLLGEDNTQLKELKALCDRDVDILFILRP